MKNFHNIEEYTDHYLNPNTAQLIDGFWYLATPYAKIDSVKAQDEAAKAVAYLMSRNVYVISPILHTAPAAKYFHDSKQRNVDFILHYDGAIINGACGVIFYLMDGWKESHGMENEFKAIQMLNKPWFWMGTSQVALFIEFGKMD